MEKPDGFLKTIKNFVYVKKEERLLTFLLLLWFFLFICSYYILRPVRRGIFLEGLGNEYLPFVYIGTALITGIVVWLYSKFTHFPRRYLISGIYGFFFITMLGWWWLLRKDFAVVSALFWIWLDVFSIMGVTTFWMYANDVFSALQARRLFGIVLTGGGLGAIFGSSVTLGFVQRLGAVNMVLVSAGILAVILILFRIIEGITQKTPSPKRAAREFENYSLSRFSQALSVIFSNRFLFFLLLVVCLERIVPDIVQFFYNEVLTSMAQGKEAISALDACLERWRSMGELTVEFFFIMWVLRYLGTGFALSSSGITISLGLFCFMFFPVFWLVLFIFHADEGMRHSWFKAGKELTYTVTSHKVLYKVKPIIEMFFYRLSRGLAGLLIYLVISVSGTGLKGLAVLGIFLAMCWTWFGLKLSMEYSRLEKES